MIYLIVVLLVTLVGLIAFLWVGTYFFQGYLYTEPSPGLYWQAPVAGAIMAAGFAVWCFIVAFLAGATPSSIPINALHQFTAKEDMFDSLKPAPKVWAIKTDRLKNTDGEKIEYTLDRLSQKQFRYLDTTAVKRPWNSEGVIAVEIVGRDGTPMRLDLTKTDPGQNRRFRSSDGWEMVETGDGPTGNPERFLFGRLLVNLFFNLAHLAGWFIVLCLVLRFSWGQALGFAVVLWLVVTLFILPELLSNAASVAQKRQTAALMQQ